MEWNETPLPNRCVLRGFFFFFLRNVNTIFLGVIMLYFKMNKNLFQPTLIKVKCPFTCSGSSKLNVWVPRLVEGKLMAVKNFKENMYLSHIRGHLAFIRVSWIKFS